MLFVGSHSPIWGMQLSYSQIPHCHTLLSSPPIPLLSSKMWLLSNILQDLLSQQHLHQRLVVPAPVWSVVQLVSNCSPNTESTTASVWSVVQLVSNCSPTQSLFTTASVWSVVQLVSNCSPNTESVYNWQKKNKTHRGTSNTARYISPLNWSWEQAEPKSITQCQIFEE